MMDFFRFLIWVSFFHFIPFGLSPSGFGYDGFFLFFELGLLFPFYWLWFKSVGFRLWLFFLSFWFRTLFFHFIAFGLSPWGLGYDGFLFFLSWGFFFILCLWFKSVGFRLWWFFFCVFEWGLVFPFDWLWFKSVGFRLWWIFFSDLRLPVPFYCLWFKSVSFRL